MRRDWRLLRRSAWFYQNLVVCLQFTLYFHSLPGSVFQKEEKVKRSFSESREIFRIGNNRSQTNQLRFLLRNFPSTTQPARHSTHYSTYSGSLINIRLHFGIRYVYFVCWCWCGLGSVMLKFLLLSSMEEKACGTEFLLLEILQRGTVLCCVQKNRESNANYLPVSECKIRSTSLLGLLSLCCTRCIASVGAEFFAFAPRMM